MFASTHRCFYDAAHAVQSIVRRLEVTAGMDIYQYIARMKPFVASRDWDGLERRYRELSSELAGTSQADRIANLAFPAYEAKLCPLVVKAIAGAKSCKAKAIYFEYDLDNDWHSGFFLCGQYNPESANDEDWACDWIKDFRGPDFPEASAIYCENNFDRTPLAKGSTLYLVARTVAAFGRCLQRAGPLHTTVCMGFHDQTPIMRIAEAA